MLTMMSSLQNTSEYESISSGRCRVSRSHTCECPHSDLDVPKREEEDDRLAFDSCRASHSILARRFFCTPTWFVPHRPRGEFRIAHKYTRPRPIKDHLDIPISSIRAASSIAKHILISNPIELTSETHPISSSLDTLFCYTRTTHVSLGLLHPWNSIRRI